MFTKMKSFLFPLARKIVATDREGGDQVLHGAPAALLFHTSPWTEPANAIIACTYAMLAAEAAGLGTTMVGCAAPPLQRRRDVMARLGVPAGHVPTIVLVVGFPATSYVRAVQRAFPWVSYA